MQSQPGCRELGPSFHPALEVEHPRDLQEKAPVPFVPWVCGCDQEPLREHKDFRGTMGVFVVFTHESFPGKQFLFISPCGFCVTGSCLLYPVSLPFLVCCRSSAGQGSVLCVCRPQHAGHVSSLSWSSDSAVSLCPCVSPGWDRALLLPARLGHSSQETRIHHLG